MSSSSGENIMRGAFVKAGREQVPNVEVRRTVSSGLSNFCMAVLSD
jgi:hypothetical protein